MSFRIRPAAPRDVDAVVDLWQLRDRRDPVELRERAERWFSREMVEECQLVAEIGGRTVGWARATFMDCTEGAPSNCVPPEWYLLGLNVALDARRLGIGRALTAARLAWLEGRAESVWYFTDSGNGGSLALHGAFGFELVRRGVWFPGIPNPDDEVLLLRAILPGQATDAG